jgi:hypothetical protein
VWAGAGAIAVVAAASALVACSHNRSENLAVATTVNSGDSAKPNTTPPITPLEKPMDGISRAPPPDVAPIAIDGVIYAQVLNARTLGMPVSCGYLKAEDSKTGASQWLQKIYDVKTNPADETDVQEVYFRRLERVPGQRVLRIENEAGGRFTLNIDTRQVTAEP